MQQQMAQLAQENAGLRDRVQAAEQQTAGAGGGSGGSAEVLQALSRLPEVLEKMSKRGGGGLIDQKGLGKLGGPCTGSSTRAPEDASA